MASNSEAKDILRELNTLFWELTGNRAITLTPRSKLNEAVGLTSLGFVQYICLIEEHYCIEIPNASFHAFRRVKDLVKYIKENKG